MSELRRRLAPFALIALFVYCVATLAWAVVKKAQTGQDRQEKDRLPLEGDEHVRSLRPLLPARGVVGYLTDAPGPLGFPYVAAQYELAPVVITGSTAEVDLVVGRFESEASARTIGGRHGLAIVKDAGGGVFLLGRKR